MEKDLLKVISYFSNFDYSPDFDELYTFFPKKTSRKGLKTLIFKLIRQKRLIIDQKSQRYTVGEYSKDKVKSQKSKVKISKKKLGNWRFRLYLKLIYLFPQIKLVGLSGSISMMNAEKDDDIDLFVITAKKRLFTGRFLTLVLAQIFGLRRHRDSVNPIFITRESHQAKLGPLESEKIVSTSPFPHSNKVCLNLFFDESNLKIPKLKQTVFVGHEVLQMKPLINKDNIYEQFLTANQWVFRLFPNAKSKVKSQKSKVQVKSQNFLFLTLIFNFSLLTFNLVESFLKKLQMTMINSHRTTELISDSQLWFHPDDFEKKIPLDNIL